MKRVVIALVCLVAFLAGFALGRYSPLEHALERYREVVQGEIPEDIRLTLYGRYVHNIPEFWSTDTHITPEEVMAEHNIMITVGPDQLALHWGTFQELLPAVLDPASEIRGYVSARVYYVLEIGDGQGNYEKILEVLYDKPGENVLVNGVEVEDTDLFCDLVSPFVADYERSGLYLV